MPVKTHVLPELVTRRPRFEISRPMTVSSGYQQASIRWICCCGLGVEDFLACRFSSPTDRGLEKRLNVTIIRYLKVFEGIWRYLEVFRSISKCIRASVVEVHKDDQRSTINPHPTDGGRLPSLRS